MFNEEVFLLNGLCNSFVTSQFFKSWFRLSEYYCTILQSFPAGIWTTWLFTRITCEKHYMDWLEIVVQSVIPAEVGELQAQTTLGNLVRPCQIKRLGMELNIPGFSPHKSSKQACEQTT